MRRRVGLFVVVFTVVAVVWAFGGGPAEELDEEKIDNQVVVRYEKSYAGVQLQVQAIDLKPGFKQGKSVAFQGKTVWPLFNLDIFGKAPVGYKADRSIKSINPQISVEIPFSYVESISKQDAAGLEIVFYVNGMWQSAEDLTKSGEIANYSKTSASFAFDILKWPADDRMCGCGN